MLTSISQLLKLLAKSRQLKEVVDLSVDAGVTITGKARLSKIFVAAAMSAHTVAIKDGSTTVFTIPASAGAGTIYDLGDMPMDTSIVVTPNASSTGTIVLIYEPVEG